MYCSGVIVFTVPGAPVPSQRAGGVTRGGKTWRYTPAKSRAYMQLVKAIAFAKCDHPYPGEVRLDVTFYVPDRIRRDRDNLLKSLKDGLNGIAWIDDSQCVSGDTVKVLDASDPRTRVVITHLGAGEFAALRGKDWLEYTTKHPTR